ncbi:hypothetical protein Syun_010147 [Stephania yunnanensis]|uniref:FHA domain-containing protein n=1 Tax=Stephania yunnanensis TaxID=152371 RepID=A0AAP0PPD3_9MAGN
MSPAVHRNSTMRRGSSSEESDSPPRRSPPRRERSPARRRSSPKTDSPVRMRRARSPVREKVKLSSRDRSPVREREKLSSRDLSSVREREKLSSRERSPKRGRMSPPASSSRSPSPRTKRLKRVQAGREVEKVSDRERGRSGRDDGGRERHRDRSVDREDSIERNERRSGRDSKKDGGSSRSRHNRSASPIMERGNGNNRHGSRSPPPRGSRSGGRDKVSSPRRGDHRNDDEDAVARMEAAEAALEAKEKQKPSFELSGKLAAETNRVRGVTLLFSEPPEARKPDVRWRLYVFKGGEVLNEPLYIHRQSCYLFGRERRVADVPTDHPSCSKQHAVIQFRQVEKEQPDGMLAKKVRPYVMDLGSTNGTFINDNRVEPQRYYELFEKDTIKFGNSSREYVLLHENSA